MLVQIDLVVISLTHVFGIKRLKNRGLHKAGLDRFVNGRFEFGDRSDYALFRGVFCSPNGQWNSPVPGSRKVPIIRIGQPVAKTTLSGRLRLPVDFFIEFNHALLHLSHLYKPRVKRIIQHRLVCSPAIWIRVNVLLYLKGFIFCLQLNGDFNIDRFFRSLIGLVVSVLNEFVGIRAELFSKATL